MLAKSSVFQDEDGPRYVKAFVAHIVVYGVQLATILLLRVHLMRQNVLKRRKQGLNSKKSAEEMVMLFSRLALSS